MVLYQEREFHRRRLAQLDQQVMEAKNHRDAETNILRAQLAGARKEIEWGFQQQERFEDLVKETRSREEKAQQALESSRDRSTQLAGEIAAVRKHIEEVEEVLGIVLPLKAGLPDGFSAIFTSSTDASDPIGTRHPGIQRV